MLTTWIRFRLELDDETLGWFETQASEFAGRVLVPVDPLVEEFRSKRNSILKKYASWDSKPLSDDDLFSMVAPMICGRFDVSSDVIERRLRKENVAAILGR